MTQINICTAVNSKYARYLYVMLFSLFESNEDTIHIYVLQADLSADEKCYLNELACQYDNKMFFVDIDISRFEEKLPKDEHFSIETYFRLMMPELLNNIDKVLYLDVDIIIQGPIRELYHVTLGESVMAVCQDMLVEYLDNEYQRRFERYGHIPYFNAGVVLYDLDKIRKQYTFSDFMDAARKLNFNLPYVDQDILNYLFYGQVKWMDRYKYNYMPASDCGEYLNDGLHHPSIVHFAGANPWAVKKEPSIGFLWWRYAKKTKWYMELLEEYVSRLEASIKNEYYLREQNVLIKKILEHFKLEDKEKVLVDLFKHLREDFGIYGAGYIAEKFYELLERLGLNINLKVVIDQEKRGEFHGLPIIPNFDFIDAERKYLIVVTPTYGLPELMRIIQKIIPSNVKIISLLDFVNGRI